VAVRPARQSDLIRAPKLLIAKMYFVAVMIGISMY
jgi:hypothetical protein